MTSGYFSANRFQRHPRNNRSPRRGSPLGVPEVKAPPYPYFLPYDGLRIASDKVLGKLFVG